MEYQAQLEALGPDNTDANFSVSQVEKSAKTTILDSQDIKVFYYTVQVRRKQPNYCGRSVR